MRVGIVTRDTVLRRVLCRFVQGLEHDSCVLHDGESNAAAADGRDPDVILLDLREDYEPRMPQLETIHKEYPSLPILAMVPQGRSVSSEVAASLGLYWYFYMPIHLTELEVALRRLNQERGVKRS